MLGYEQQASSRSTSQGQAPAASEEAACGSAGPSFGAPAPGIVRRAARRGTRAADQAFQAAHGYGGGGNGGYGSGGPGYGGYGHMVGPLGFAPSERTGGKQGKGLRHFSMKVCEKVEGKGTTTYNEVADELVAEMKGSQLEDGVVYDEKNIRRRVYDAINVRRPCLGGYVQILACGLGLTRFGSALLLSVRFALFLHCDASRPIPVCTPFL